MDFQANYIRQVRRPNSDDFFIAKWGGCILRNVDSDGTLYGPFTSKAKYIRVRRPMWIFLKLVVFKDSESSIFPVYQCNSCEDMKAVDSMSLTQNPDEIQQLKCVHSKVTDILVGDDWLDYWDLDLQEIQNAQESYSVWLHQEVKAAVFRKDSLFLGAVLTSRKKINILYTINKKQKFPFCSDCTRQKCKCFKTLEAGIDAENRRLLELDPNYDTTNHWEKMQTQRPEKAKHYEDTPQDFHTRYGYNRTRFIFPIHRDPEMQTKYQEKLKNQVTYPTEFIPEVDPTLLCTHGYQFDADPARLTLLGETATIIYESHDEELNIKRFGRPTIGHCGCILQSDTHEQVGFLN